MKSSSSLSVPVPPVPPPELTKSGKPLNKKEKKAVCPRLFYSCSPRIDFHTLISSRNKLLGQNGSTSPLLPKQIYLACTKSTRHCVCAINLIQSAFTAKTPEKGAVLRASPNTSPCAFNLPLLFYLHAQSLYSTDWYDRCNEHTIR